MNDLLQCAELCEQHGFSRGAETLRSASEGRLTLFVVMQWVPYQDEYEWPPDPEEGGKTLAASFDRAEAEAIALRENREQFRKRGVLKHFYEEEDLIGPQSVELFNQAVSRILGRDYVLPRVGDIDVDKPLIPEDATDDQAERITRMLSARFFDVVEVPFQV